MEARALEAQTDEARRRALEEEHAKTLTADTVRGMDKVLQASRLEMQRLI